MNLPTDLKKKSGKIAQWLVMFAIVGLALYVLGQNADVLVWTALHPKQARHAKGRYEYQHRLADKDYYSDLSVMVSPLPEEEK